MVRPILSKAAETKDRHLSKGLPGSSAGVNKSQKITGDDELEYEEQAAEDARRERLEAEEEDARDARSSAPDAGTQESATSSSNSIGTTSTATTADASSTPASSS